MKAQVLAAKGKCIVARSRASDLNEAVMATENFRENGLAQRIVVQ
jgi:hypothetical protein